MLHTPTRIEEGIARNTIAFMQRIGARRHPYEIWVMIQQKKRSAGGGTQKTIAVISAWKYPGITKTGEPLPGEILSEIQELHELS